MQLGLGKWMRWNSAGIPRPEALSRHGVVLVACREWHMLVLHPNGSISSCGDNALGHLGRRLSVRWLCDSVPGIVGKQMERVGGV